MQIWKPFIKNTLAVSLSAILMACGGGSSGGSTAGNGATTPGGASGTTPVTPQQYTLKVPVKYRDNCGNPIGHPDAEVMVHDANWNIVASASPDENGIVELTLDEPNASVSVVTVERKLSDADVANQLRARINVQVYPDLEMKDYSESSTLDYYAATAPEATCDCAEGVMTMDLPNSLNDQAERIFSSAFLQHQLLSDNEVSLQVCKQQGVWPVAWYATRDAFTDVRSLGITNNFEELETTGRQTLPFEHFASELSVSANELGFETLSMANTVNGELYSWARNNDTALPYYPSVYEQYGGAYRITGDASIPFAGGNLFVHRELYSFEPVDALALRNDLQVPQLTEQGLLQMVETNRFDFSGDTSLPFVAFTVNYGNDSVEANFEYYGTTTGDLPDVEVYRGYQAFFSNPTVANVSFRFFDYGNMVDKSNTALSELLLDNAPVTGNSLASDPRQEFRYVEFRLDAIYL